MSNVAATDPNFRVETKIKETDICFYDVLQPPFSIHGVFYQDGKFRRLPETVAKQINDAAYCRRADTAGGRVRFKTNSAYVAIHAKMSSIVKMSHFALTGSAGFDLYCKKDGEQRYVGTFVPPYDIQDGFESILHFPTAEMREITINMPLYSEVCQLYIGLQEDSSVCPPEAYTYPTPIVYYGSSITQGGCASRPGMAYQNIITRRLDTDYVNLGFSGGARGEEEIAAYISKLDMSVFVYDYDYNAPTAEHLQQTHERMYLTIRQAHPHIPIIMMSRPKRYLTPVEEKRRDIVEETYRKAKQRGENVYFLSGQALMADAGDNGNVDGTHPTDFGFASMAHYLGDLLEQIL